MDERALRKLATAVLLSPSEAAVAIEHMRLYLERCEVQIRVAEQDALHHQTMQQEAMIATAAIEEETKILREQLIQEQALRLQREEYNRLARQVMELPSDLATQIQQVQAETENLRTRQLELAQQTAENRLRIGRILQQLESLGEEMRE